MRRLLVFFLTNFPFSYLQVHQEVQEGPHRMVGILATALCPGIHPHAARYFCSALAVLGRLTELTAVLCTHIHLSFKQRDTHKNLL